jgi:hypothetical protein
MKKSRPVNYRGYSIAKAERGSGFVVSKDGKQIVNMPSMAAAYTWIDREVQTAKEDKT